MIYKLFSALAIICSVLITATNQAHGQARSSVGVSIGADKRLKGNNRTSEGFTLHANIKIINQLALEPAIGLRAVGEEGTLHLAGKYFFNNNLFITAGPFVALSDGIFDGGGGSGSVGYRLFPDKRNNLEFSVRTDILSQNQTTTPFLGLRLAYNFNFRKL